MLIRFMYNKREMEIVLFLEENGFVERHNTFCKDIEDDISILVKDLNAIKVDFRILYFESARDILEIRFFFEFDKKLILDLCGFSKKVIDNVNNDDFDIIHTYVAENKDGVLHFFSNGIKTIKYVNDEFVFV